MALHTHGNQPSRRRTLNTVDDVFNVPTTNQEVEVIGDSYIPNKHSTDIDIHDESFEPIVLLKEPFEIEVEAEPEVPSDILFVVDSACTLTIGLAGSGTIDIDWGDGVTETETLRAYGEGFYEELWEFTHVFTGRSTVKIVSAANVTAIAINSNKVSVLEVSENLTDLFHLRVTAPLTEFITHAEWTKLDYITFQECTFSSLTLYPEWVDLRIVIAGSTGLTSLSTHKEWTKITYFAVFNSSSLTSVETHKEWVLLQLLGLYGSGLTSITTHKEWTKMITISARNTVLTTIQLHPEWTLFETLLAENSTISSLTLYPQLTQLRTINLSYTPITSIVLFNTMVNNKIYDVNFSNCSITDANVINNILIVLDSVITSNSPSKTIRLNGGTNAAPTGAGITAKNSIISKGCTVQTN